MQFQSKRTVQSNLKVSRQSNAILKASRQSNASSNFKSSGLCVWALVAGQTRCVICLKHVDTRLSHNKYILCYLHKLYNKQCRQKDEPQKYHIVIQYAITICAKCNVWNSLPSQYVQCVNHNAITMAQTARGQSWPGRTVPTAANLVQTQSLYEDSECLYSDQN